MKRTNLYPQSQQHAARVLLAVWLLASGSPESALAAPERQPAIVPATTTSPQGPPLASTSSTPTPGGQLPPDPPDPLWGDSVAIDAAPQRQPACSLFAKTLAKLVSLLCRPRPQEAPITQARPVAKGDENPSKALAILHRLIQAARSEQEEDREAAEKCLVAVIQATPSEVPAIIPTLAEAAKEQTYSVRSAAVSTLSKVLEVASHEAPAIIPILVGIVQDHSGEMGDYPIRRDAFEALLKMFEAAPLQALTIPQILKGTTKDSDSRIRRNAVQSLARIVKALPSEASAIIEQLREASEDPSWNVRLAAAEALGSVATLVSEEAPAIISILIETIKDQEQGVVSVAVKALGSVAIAVPGEAPEIVQVLIKGATATQWVVRQAAVEALGSVARTAPSETQTITPILIEAAKDPYWEFSPITSILLNFHMDQYKEKAKHYPVREAALEALRYVDPSKLSDAYKAREVANLAEINSYIALAKLSHFVERTATTEQLSATLAHKGVCVLHGFGGAGKSTLAAHYGHERKDTQTVRWIGAEDSRKLQEGYEKLAQELRVDHKSLAKKLAAKPPSQYRQELARKVYDALARNNQPTLLILDNVEDASLIADYLLHRPSALQAIITTRNAKAFVGQYDQLQLSAFSQDEGRTYLEIRFKQMERAYSDQEISALLKEVGLVPQKLSLAAGYLQRYELVATSQYIARLQALKQAGIKQRGQLRLPQVALGLETLTKEGQQLMQYIAYLDADFTPLSLVSTLLGEEDPEQLSETANDLSRLSLIQVVYNGTEKLGLQVHREVQAACREYEDWRTEATLGTQSTILSKLAEVLAAQMPWVRSSPDERWQRAKLYAPNVATVLSRLSSSNAEPSAAVARLLDCMGQYSKEVALNYPEALEHQKQALQIYQTLHEGDHTDVARALSEIGTTLSRAGQLQEALENKLQVLEIRKRLAKGQDDPEVAYALNSVGELLTHLGRHQEALQYKQESLEMRQRLSKNQDDPGVARSLISVGIGLENLGKLPEALASKQKALEMRERLTPSQDNTDIAHSLQNVGETEIKIGKAEQGLAHCQQGLAMRKRLFKDKDHPNIAQSLYGVGLGYAALGDYQQAAAHYQQAVEMALRVFKRAHQDLTKYCHHLIETLPKLDEARVQQIKAALVPLCSEVLGEEDALTKDLLAA